MSSFLLNLVYWVLWLGTGYLLFFWRKPFEMREGIDDVQPWEWHGTRNKFEG